MDNETKTDLGRLPLEIITPWSVFPVHPGLEHSTHLIPNITTLTSSLEGFQCSSTLFYNFLFSLLSVTL